MAKKNYNKISTEKPEAVETEVQETTEVTPVIGTVNCAKLNVRKQGKINADRVCIIDKDTEVTIDEAKSTKNFYKIKLANGTEGYCVKEFITLK